jgi:hypothetical protein
MLGRGRCSPAWCSGSGSGSGSGSRETAKRSYSNFKRASWRSGEKTFSPLDSTKLLHGVASKLPQWDLAVEAINDTIIERHERRIVKNDNCAIRIGEHSQGSKIQDRHSPVEPRDLRNIITLVEDGKLQILPRADYKDQTDTIDGTPIREHGLKRDRFRMIVPDGASWVVRKSSSPS